MVCLNATWESISHGDLSNVDFVIFFIDIMHIL